MRIGRWRCIWGALWVLAGVLLSSVSACTEGEDMFTTDVILNEPEPRGWSNSGILVCGDRDGMVSLQADFGNHQGIYTVQFNLKNDKVIDFEGHDARIPATAEAEIRWSVEGNEVVRKVTVTNGTSISAPAQAVRVVVRDVTQQFVGIWQDEFAIPYEVSIQVTRGSRATSAMPPMLIPQYSNPTGYLTIPGGGTSYQRIPVDAGVNALLVSYVLEGTGGPAPGLCKVELIFNGSPGFNTAGVVYDPAVNVGWMPVLPGNDLIIISNTGEDPINVTMVYGIDG